MLYSSTSFISGRPNTAISQRDDDFEDEEDVGFRSAGALNSANSRARMLAQQREIALKKRQSSISSGQNAILCT